MNRAVKSWLARAPGAGVYEGAGLPSALGRVRPTALLRQAAQCGWRAVYLDGQEIASKADILGACAQALSFPEYYGSNWDALEECLRDLSWAPTQHGYLLLYDHAERLARAAPEDYAVAHDILRSAVDYWRATATPLVVILLSSG